MSFNSPFPDVEIPNLSIYDYLFGSIADSDLAKPALIDGTSGAVTWVFLCRMNGTIMIRNVFV